MSTPLWLERHLDTPVTVVSREPTGTDEYGNVIYTESYLTTHGRLTPVAEAEIQAGRAQVGTFVLVLHSAVVGLVDGFSAFQIKGVRYEALGPPSEARSLTEPTIHHVEFTVQRSTA